MNKKQRILRKRGRIGSETWGRHCEYWVGSFGAKVRNSTKCDKCCSSKTWKQQSFSKLDTLPETNIAHENPIFPGKYHQNGGFSMAMLVSGSVLLGKNRQGSTMQTVMKTISWWQVVIWALETWSHCSNQWLPLDSSWYSNVTWLF